LLFLILEPKNPAKPKGVTWTLVRAASREGALQVLGMPTDTVIGVHEVKPEGGSQVLFTTTWEPHPPILPCPGCGEIAKPKRKQKKRDEE